AGDLAIGVERKQPLAIAGEGDGEAPAVPFPRELPQELSRRRIPQEDASVSAAHGQGLAVRGEGELVARSEGLILKSETFLARGDVPHGNLLPSAQPNSGGQRLPVRRKSSAMEAEDVLAEQTSGLAGGRFPEQDDRPIARGQESTIPGKRDLADPV